MTDIQSTDNTKASMSNIHNSPRIFKLTDICKGIQQLGKGTSALAGALEVSAKYLSTTPTDRPRLIAWLADHFEVSESEISKQIDLQDDGRVDGYKFDEALNFLASRVEADFSIDEVLPSNVARIIGESCETSNVDWKSAVFLLLAFTSGLTGNRVMCVSPRSHKPISLTTLVLNCGDSSANKDITSDKFKQPMSGQATFAKAQAQEALSTAKKIIDADQRKAELHRIEKSKTDVLSEALSFSAEAIVFEVSKRSPNNGFHIHQSEGSDFLACERWGSGQSQNSSGPGLLRKTLMEAWDGPLRGEYIRQNSDKCASFRSQSISLTINCQMRFVPEIVDFDEDSLGWTSRLLVVLAKELDNGLSPRKCRGIDPINKYMTERLIPFTQAIDSRKSDQISTTGFAMDYVQLELDPWDGAEARYESFCDETKHQVKQSEAAGIEPAYLSFLKKTPVRIMKFASLLHIFQVLEGKQIPKGDMLHGYQTYQPSCDVNYELTKNGGISLETFERAIKLELIARNQFQVVGDLCRTAPSKRAERKETGENLTLATTLLEKLQKYGEISERAFQDRVKSRSLTRQQVNVCVERLVANGRINRRPRDDGHPGFLLSFSGDVRA